MTNEELIKLCYELYKKGCNDSLKIIEDTIQNIKNHDDSIGKSFMEEFIKNMRNKQ